MERYFPQVHRNENLCKRLGNEISEGRFPHAYIIAGDKGSGKHTLALNIAAALECQNKQVLPCGICESCRKITEGYSPDVIYVRKDAEKKEFTVNLIREIKESIYIAPNELKKRVYIIEDAETMNQNAQNAFLKILEEPPQYVVFLLLCSNTQNLLETVKSRAPILNMEYITAEEITEYILKHSPRARELFETDKSKLADIVLAANGSIGAAISLCDDSDKHIYIHNNVISFLNAWISPTLLELDLFSENLAGSADEFSDFLQNLKIALRDILVTRQDESAELLFFKDAAETERFVLAITNIKALKLTEACDLLIEKLKFYLDTRLAAVTFCGDARKIMIK